MKRLSWANPLIGMCMAICAVLAAPSAAVAQPAASERPVRIIVPFLAGGSVDMVARLISARLGPRLGQPVIVDNIAGAGGVIGADHVARSQPDGLTLLMTPPGPLTTNAVLMKSMPYDAERAFSPVSLVATLPNVLLAAPKHSGWTLADFIREAKANPGKLTYASQGIGTTGHLTGVLFNQQTGVQLSHVPYKGFPPALTDVTAGRVDAMFVDTVNALPRIRSKQLVPLAVASQKRVAALPDIPTLAEEGYPGMISDTWFAVVAPAGTPVAIRQRLSDEIAAILKEPEVLERLRDLGVEPIGSGPGQLGEHIRKEFVRWRALIISNGLAPK